MARPSGFCTFHDPELTARRAAGRRSGGKERSRRAAVLPPDTADVPLASPADVIALLGMTINQVRRGELDAKVGNCLGVLAGVLLRAIEGGEMARRLEAVETRLQAAGGHRP